LGFSLPEYGYACRLHGVDLAIMFGLLMVLSVIVSSLAGIRASRLDPAECLRESV
jgi:ABC-type lipoprotein release transport system permease subunit